MRVGGDLLFGQGWAGGSYELYNGTLTVNGGGATHFGDTNGGIYVGFGGSQWNELTQGKPYQDSNGNWKTSSVGGLTNTVTAPNLYIGMGGTQNNGGAEYNLADGLLTISNNAYVGYNGWGNFNQGQAWDDNGNQIATPGGTFNAGSLYLGYNGGSNGNYVLSNGALNVSGNTYIGYSGWGSFTQGQAGDNNGNQTITPGGTFNNTGNLYLGYNGGSNGNYVLSNGALNVNGATYIGYNGSGFFSQGAPMYGNGSWMYPADSGHAISHTTGNLYIGGGPDSNANGSGGYNLYEGTLTVKGDTVVGFNGNGFLSQGGQIQMTVGGTDLPSNPTSGGIFTTTNFYLGGGPGSSGGGGYYQLASGIATVNGNTYVGYSGSGVVSQGSIWPNNSNPVVTDGGTFTNKGDLYVGYNSGSNNPSTYMLSAGTLAVGGSTYVGYNGFGNFSLGGPLYSGNNTWTYPANSPYAISHTTGNLYIGGGPGSNANGSGGYNLYEGTLTVKGDTVVGYNGNGFFSQGGRAQIGDATLGTVYSNAASGGTFTTNNLYVGYNSGSNGSYTLASGALNVAGTTYVGYNGWGNFNQSGGSHTAGSIIVGATGMYNYSGGFITGNLQNSGQVSVTGQGAAGPSNTFGATVTNNAGGQFNVSQANVTFTNAVTNAAGGTFRINESAVTFGGSFSNYGTLQTDPSTIIFNGDFTEGQGATVTSSGDTFEFTSGVHHFSAGGYTYLPTIILDADAILDLDSGTLGYTTLTNLGTIQYDGGTMQFQNPQSPVPIPGALMLLAPGLLALFGIRRRSGK